jgi:hypothetical protein
MQIIENVKKYCLFIDVMPLKYFLTKFWWKKINDIDLPFFNKPYNFFVQNSCLYFEIIYNILWKLFTKYSWF